jgi:hypothetical protein
MRCQGGLAARQLGIYSRPIIQKDCHDIGVVKCCSEVKWSPALYILGININILLDQSFDKIFISRKYCGEVKMMKI